MSFPHTDKTISKAISYICIAACAVSLLSGCSAGRSQDPVSRTGLYFDTAVTISLYDYPGSSDPILDGCMDLCGKYENLFSATVEGSDVWNINHSDGSPVTVDPETAALIDKAVYYCDLSEGKLDITLGSLISLWDFSDNSSEKDPLPPDDSLIAEALSHVNYKGVTVSHSGEGYSEGENSEWENSEDEYSEDEYSDDDYSEGEYTVTLSDPESRIELGFIAKGYIADKICEYLESCQVTSALINLGGNVKCIGGKPDGSAFTIGIQRPFDDMGSTITSVSVSDSSVVSSGVYERYYYYDDTLYHHILDPETGYPVNNDLYGVSIITESATEADALSTLAYILGLHEGQKLIESLDGTEAVFVTSDMEVVKTSGLP